MQNSVRDAFTVALKSLGYSLNTQNPDELQQAKDELIRQKPLVQAYVIDQVRDKMIGGEAAVGAIYSGEMLYIQNAVKEQEADFTLEYVIPVSYTHLIAQAAVRLPGFFVEVVEIVWIFSITGALSPVS